MKHIILKLVIIGLLTVIVVQLNNLHNFLNQKDNALGKTNNQKYSLLSKVTTGIQIDYLKKYIGEAAILNFSEDKKQKEYIFVNPDYFVQAITDPDDKILSYAITTRNKEFNPVLSISGIKFQLGKTTFYNKGDKPVDCFAFAGNTAPSYYFEAYTGWNGTTYRDYLLGYNDSGYGDRAIVEVTLPTEKDPIKPTENNKYSCRMPSDEVRKQFTINTLMVSQAGFKSEFGYGVNRREVELLNE